MHHWWMKENTSRLWMSGLGVYSRHEKSKSVASKQSALTMKKLSLSLPNTVFNLSAPLQHTFFLPHLFIFLLSLFWNFFFTRPSGWGPLCKSDQDYQRHSDFPSCLSYSDGFCYQRKDVHIQESCNWSPTFHFSPNRACGMGSAKQVSMESFYVSVCHGRMTAILLIQRSLHHLNTNYCFLKSQDNISPLLTNDCLLEKKLNALKDIFK